MAGHYSGSLAVLAKKIVNKLDVSSPALLIDIGLRQGSCVGPFTFTIYMNDIVRSYNEINFPIYADHTFLYVSGVVNGQ